VPYKTINFPKVNYNKVKVLYYTCKTEGTLASTQNNGSTLT